MSEEAAYSLGDDFMKALGGGGLPGLVGGYLWGEAEKECLLRSGDICLQEGMEVAGLPFTSPAQLGVACAIVGLLCVGLFLAYLHLRTP